MSPAVSVLPAVLVQSVFLSSLIRSLRVRVLLRTLEPYYGTEHFVRKENMPQQAIRGISFTNASNGDQELKINNFQLCIPTVDTAAMASSLTDCDFSTAYNTGEYALNTELQVPAGARTLTIVGSASCQVEGATRVGSDGLIQTFRLEEGVTTVRLRAFRQYGTRIHEAIFR